MRTNLILSTLTRIDRNARRLTEILTVLAKYGLADWLGNVQYGWIQERLVSADGQKLGPMSQEARIRLVLTELGTTFVKLGQVLSTRPDLTGPELGEELAKLQAGTPADPPATVRATIESELGAPVEDIFAEFDFCPIASASIGQVHAARLKNGQPVVVKVQHAGIAETIHRDLDILIGLAELAQNHVPALRPYQPVSVVREFRRTILRELDFSCERRNLEEFARNFADDVNVHIPKVYPEYCSRAVLTMERLEGIKGSDPEALKKAGVDLSEFAHRAANMYLDMIFRDGFYHADPHAGNYMVLPGGVVGVLDFGMVGRIDATLREDIEDILLAVVNKDAQDMMDIVVRLGSVPPELDRTSLRMELIDFVAEYSNQSLEEFDMSGALNRMVEIIRRYHILLPTSCSLLLKTLIMLEGTSRQLNPHFSLAELLKPYQVKIMRGRLSPRRWFRKWQRLARDWDRFFEMLPRDLGDILQRVHSGSFEIKHEHAKLESTVNRLVEGILAAALFLGSTALWSWRAPPVIGDVSVFGALGYAGGLFLSVRLLWDIHKSEKHKHPNGR